MNKLFKHIYYGNLYLVQCLEDDYELQLNYQNIFKDSIYIPSKNFLLINLGSYLFYKISENTFINLNSYETIYSNRIKNNEYYIIKENLVPYIDFKNNEYLENEYSKKEIKKLIKKYYVRKK